MTLPLPADLLHDISDDSGTAQAESQIIATFDRCNGAVIEHAFKTHIAALNPHLRYGTVLVQTIDGHQLDAALWVTPPLSAVGRLAWSSVLAHLAWRENWH